MIESHKNMSTKEVKMDEKEILERLAELRANISHCGFFENNADDIFDRSEEEERKLIQGLRKIRMKSVSHKNISTRRSK